MALLPCGVGTHDASTAGLWPVRTWHLPLRPADPPDLFIAGLGLQLLLLPLLMMLLCFGWCLLCQQLDIVMMRDKVA